MCKALPVERWLKGLGLAPASQVAIRGILHRVWDYAMFRQDVPVGRNPMSLVRIKGGSKPLKQAPVLTEDEFREFSAQLAEPFRTIALICVCFGLRISECLGLKWCDVDWEGSRLKIERGVVRQRVGPVKTENSQQTLVLDEKIVDRLAAWRKESVFAADSDWMFASVAKLGRQPLSYPGVWKAYSEAAIDAGLAHFGTHTLRHSYRAGLGDAGAPIDVQRRLMRHVTSGPQ